MSPTKEAKAKTKLQELEAERDKAWQEWQAAVEELAGAKETLNTAIKEDLEAIADAGDDADYFATDGVAPHVAAVKKRLESLPIVVWSRHLKFVEADHRYREVKLAQISKRVEPLGRAIEEKREELRKLESDIASMHHEHADLLNQRRELELSKHDYAQLEGLRANPPGNAVVGLMRMAQESN